MNNKLKSILSIAWKGCLALLGIGIAGLVILLAIVWYDARYGRNSYDDKPLSENIIVHAYNNNRVRLWDKRTGRYISPKLLWVSGIPENDSITVYCTPKHNRGYLNCNTGKITIDADKARYVRAWQFGHGRAFVILPGSEKLSLIDYGGNVIAKDVATYCRGFDYVFEDEYFHAGKDGYYGVLAADGSWAIEPKYSYITYPYNGYRIAADDNGYWLFDSSMNLVFDKPYEKIKFAEGREDGNGVLYVTRDHVKQLINYDGSVVEPFVIDGTYDLTYKSGIDEDGNTDYTLSLDIAVYTVDSFEGLLDKRTGRIITKANYTDFEMISKDLIRAELSLGYNGEAVIMDKNGRIINK